MKLKTIIMKYLLSVLLFLSVLSGSAQTDNPITVHEWGTFTSKYTGYGKPYLDVHTTIDEPVPGFVHTIDFEKKISFQFWAKEDYYYQDCNVNLMDVSIKMETPVLYFYSKTTVKNLIVDVKFPQGSISELYPSPMLKEDENYVKSKCKFTNNNIPGNGPPVTLSFKNYNGYAKWNINILAPDDLAKPTESDESVPNVWLAPRKTKANIIEANGEREKYIFYRGLGGFTNPIIPSYTQSGNIVLTNSTGQNIPYVLVYEKSADGKRFVWGVNSINGNTSDAFIRNWNEVNDETWINVHRKKFVSELVKSGLYEDEAEAMLNTWDKSYFGKPGIKIFWIVPRSFTDEILPISFSQPIASLERVMIGRTEIDPFNISEVNQYLSEPNLKIANTEYTVFPNPSTSDLFIKCNKQRAEMVKIEMIDYSGRVVKSCEMEVIPFSNCKIPFENITKGIYCLKISGDNNTKLVKISMQ